ncbi:hypothetical protein F442_17868 [Phytophthora nicotianae P10297]|uniref:Uncharacterized protein n=2 Tax=Phytophthora nicotianae TaxID=4792 RepID=W2YFQ5_PHYNI|nr:hypothetical protein L917_17280 [Phytophthora nicotianae]ETP33637.1 hypothetical protein F442_17868 [Phytophthora nicotianae P10297]
MVSLRPITLEGVPQAPKSDHPCARLSSPHVIVAGATSELLSRSTMRGQRPDRSLPRSFLDRVREDVPRCSVVSDVHTILSR